MKIEHLKNLIQSCNINFLIGSGLSKPYLETLGNIETWLTELENKKENIDSQEYELIKTSIFKYYFDKVIYPNTQKEINKRKALYQETLNNYKEFLLLINNIVLKRKNTLLTKQINLYTTNIDLFFERALEETALEFNDGFKGRITPTFDLTNFQKSYSKTSLHYDNISEIPVFNLLKVHGSINWRKREDRAIVYTNALNRSLSKIKTELENINNDVYISTLAEDEEDVTIDLLIERAKSKSSEFEIKDGLFDKFYEEYENLIMVNPTKTKFKETIFEEQYYEMMRIYANSLEKINTLLFVMGFSFADEHIKNMTIRAAKSNPTLQIIAFAYNDTAKDEIISNLGKCNSENIQIITPEIFIDNSGLEPEEKTKLRKLIKVFDFSTINQFVFSEISKIIMTTSKF